MKKPGLLLLALLLGSIPYVVAQQPIEVPPLVPPAPVGLVATDHLPLPKDLSQYWYVPAKATDARFATLARGVKAITAGEYANGLALVARPDLAETPLAAYARYYEAIALQGLSRLPEADAILTRLSSGP
ncbi:MAG TPA: hypothetical protein VFS23_06145, partial [Vicinamibacterales bacterium]|nr:hypothetical protein [Vicinamibacterales bacterium]